MSDLDSRMYVRSVLNEGVVSQRDIEVGLAHDAIRASRSRTSIGRRSRRALGRLGHFLVDIAEAPTRASDAGT